MEFQANVVREVPGEYVRAGASYTVTRTDRRGAHYHFRNNETGGATYMAPWAFEAAVKSGAVVRS